MRDKVILVALVVLAILSLVLIFNGTINPFKRSCIAWAEFLHRVPLKKSLNSSLHKDFLINNYLFIGLVP